MKTVQGKNHVYPIGAMSQGGDWFEKLKRFKSGKKKTKQVENERMRTRKKIGRKKRKERREKGRKGNIWRKVKNKLHKLYR